jgi:hypothetical protein
MPDQARIHFLHIGKTGGSAVKSALLPWRTAGDFELVLHRHRTRLKDLPSGEKVVFMVRDPISRVISGFYSRRRKGQPRTYVEWSPAEREAFLAFETPGALAEALGAADAVERAAAERAFGAIQHVRDRYRFWLGSARRVEERFSDILFVGRQERLDEDFARLLPLLGLPDTITLPSDPVVAHRNPPDIDRTLTDRGETQLRMRLADDYEILDRLSEYWMPGFTAI